MPSIYQLKSRFQDLLRPLLRGLVSPWRHRQPRHARRHAGLHRLRRLAGLPAGAALPWLLLPVFLFLRMALNAIDGMLAREHGQKSRLGGILNEVGDVVSDAALYLPFALLLAQPAWVALAVVLALLTEFVGVLGPSLGASRRYDRPMGKSDRAFVYGAYALLLACGRRRRPGAAGCLD